MTRRKSTEDFLHRTPPPGTFVAFTDGEKKAYRALMQNSAETKEAQLIMEAELNKVVAENRRFNADFWGTFRKRTGILPTEVTAGTVTTEGVTIGTNGAKPEPEASAPGEQ